MADNTVCWWIQMVRLRAYSRRFCADSFVSNSSFTNQSPVLIVLEARKKTPKTVIWFLLLNLHWGMKKSLHVRQVYWSSMNNPTCYVWNCGITSNWIFMGATWTAGLPMCHSILTWNMLHECFIPGSHVMCDFHWHLSVQPLSASHVRIHPICINIWFWQIFKTTYWSSF